MKKIPDWFPVAGIALFCILYVIATLMYPGGSAAEPDAIGFSWQHNFWCTLMQAKAINGQINPARPFALASMFDLWVTVAVFLHLFAKKHATGHFSEHIIRYGGVIASTTACFIFTPWHDQATIIASGVATVVFVVVIRSAITRLKRVQLTFGALSLVVVIGNNIIYYTGWHMGALPVIQKISFISVFAWMLVVHQEWVKKPKISEG